MNRKQIQRLRVHSGPAITIVSSCHPGAYAKAFEEAGRALQELDMGDFEHRLELAKKGFVCPVDLEGKMAVFIDAYRCESFLVPDDVADLVVVGNAFVLDPILTSLYQKKRFWILDCTGEIPVLREAIDGMINTVFAVCSIEFADCPVEKSFCFSFDRCIVDYFEADRLPIVLVGVGVHADYAASMAPYANYIVARVDVLDQAWPAYEEWLQERIQAIEIALPALMPDKEYVLDLAALYEYAFQGHIETLLIKEDYHVTVCQNRVTGELSRQTGCSVGFSSIDAVTDLCIRVHAMGGEVLIVSHQFPHSLIGFLRADV